MNVSDEKKPFRPWAFPQPTGIAGRGMDMRDYFAAAALQAIHGGAADIFTASLVPPEHVPPGEHRAYIEKRIAELAGTVYAIADAMLIERSKP